MRRQKYRLANLNLMASQVSSPAGPPACPCLSGLPYDECCGRIHGGIARAATAEQLMRSRYSAFARGDVRYLLASWYPDTRPRSLELDASLRWYRLDILSASDGGILATSGTVEFRAYYRSPTGAGEQHELSRFVKERDHWFYLGPG